MMLSFTSIAILLLLGQAEGKVLSVDEVIERAERQYEHALSHIQLGKQYPADGRMNGNWRLSTNSWTDGFFPGVLWQLYDHTKKDIWRQRAVAATDGLFKDQFATNTHDIGFLVMCSYGEGLRLTNNATYAPIIINAANHLAMRFNPTVGCTRSWGDVKDTDHFLVIVDNMMNLELLFKANQLKANSTLVHMAVSHANRTLESHIRPDHSSFHVVDFNPANGQIQRRYTAQGYSDNSCWSRGQAWLVNGYTTTHAYTQHDHYLEAAQNLASYFVAHLPAEDSIAPWDFDVPHDREHVYIPRDVSASAIAAVGLFELYQATHNQTYLASARKIVSSLASEKYLVSSHAKFTIPALLGNSTIAGPNADPSKSDLALIYADYYMLKALAYVRKLPSTG